MTRVLGMTCWRKTTRIGRTPEREFNAARHGFPLRQSEVLRLEISGGLEKRMSFSDEKVLGSIDPWAHMLDWVWKSMLRPILALKDPSIQSIGIMGYEAQIPLLILRQIWPPLPTFSFFFWGTVTYFFFFFNDYLS